MWLASVDERGGEDKRGLAIDHSLVGDTEVLKKFSSHAFQRSAVTRAFDSEVLLQPIVVHLLEDAKRQASAGGVLINQ